MAKDNRKAALAGLIVVLLGGCQSVPLLGGLHSSRHAPQDGAAEPRNARALIEVGRRQLDRGAYGMAIDTFRVALATGEDAAAALNGMGVAYANLGRADVAESLFLKAQQRDPTNERYARNLRSIQDQAASPMQAAADQAVERAASAPAAAPGLPAAERIRRVSPQEVAVVTFVTGSGPARLAQVSRAPQRSVVIRAGEADGQAASPGQATPKAADTSAGQGFTPIARIDLDAAKARAGLAMKGNRAGPGTRIDKRFKPVVRIDLSADAAVKERTASRIVPVDTRFKPVVRIDLDQRPAGSKRAKVVTFALADRRPL